MTLRLPEAEVRQLYEWWKRGDISLYGASKCLRCDRRTVQRRFAQWDEKCAQIVEQRKAQAHEQYVRRVIDGQKSTAVWTKKDGPSDNTVGKVQPVEATK